MIREKETVSREETIALIPLVVVVEGVDVGVPVVIPVDVETKDYVHKTFRGTVHRVYLQTVYYFESFYSPVSCTNFFLFLFFNKIKQLKKTLSPQSSV